MHTKTRLRGKVIRYVKNPNYTTFNRAEPLSEVRAVKGQHVINKSKVTRSPSFPERDVPTANKAKTK